MLAALTRIRVGNLPRESELAAAPRLDAWTVLPVTPGPVLLGIVSGHPHLREGARIAMSPLLWLAPDRRSARTVSRWYRLGRRLGGTAAAVAEPGNRDDR